MNELASVPRPDGGLRELALFAGAGGGILGGHLLGWRCVCAVEWNAYAASVLAARQNDRLLPPFPIWDDVRTFDGRPWRGLVDVVSGGFPCQDISVAGNGDGLDGERSGLWSEMARIIGEVRPRFAFVENSPALTSRGLGRVLGDLAALGYDCRWGVVSAANAGAPHVRERIWILADAECLRQSGQGQCQEPIHTAPDPYREAAGLVRAFREDSLPYLCRVHDGLGAELDRLTAIGNGQVPQAAALAWRTLTGNLK